jgi:hypothetical protein
VKPPGLEVAVYVTDPFPAYAGGVNATDTEPSPAVTDPIVGTPGVFPDWAAVLPRIGIGHILYY